MSPGCVAYRLSDSFFESTADTSRKTVYESWGRLREHEAAADGMAMMKKKLREMYRLIEGIDTAMFTTRRRDGRLVSRPMANQVAAAGADLWFVTAADSPKLLDLARDPQVNLAYYRNRTREWVSVSGVAKISTDRSKVRELYRPDWKAWFGDEGGVHDGTAEDPRMVLIGVTVESALFMEVTKPKPVILFELIRGVLTGKAPRLGTTHRITKRDTRRRIRVRRRSGRTA